MGMTVRRFFEEAEQAAGIVGKMRLASMTKITSTQAASIEDTPELVARFKNAMMRLERELGIDVPHDVPSGAVAKRPGTRLLDDEITLRQRSKVLQELLTQRALFLGDVAETARRITESASACLDVQRSSVWMLSADRSVIRCIDLFLRDTGGHEAGAELTSADYPTYFAALSSQRTIAASDACNDPRTSCFTESYLAPLDIRAMLDVPIWANGAMVGVVCNEHVGETRRWTEDDETFASSLGSLVALALERHRA